MFSGEREWQSFPQNLSRTKTHFCLVAAKRLTQSNYSHLRTLWINQTKHRQNDSCSGASSLRHCAGRRWRRWSWCRSAHRIDLSRHDGNSKRKAEDRYGAYLA